MTEPEQTIPDGWQAIADRSAGYYEHCGGRWMMEPCWTGRGVELFKRTSDPTTPWTVVLVFDDVGAAARYVERQ